jgi:hypothetical protein
MVFGSSRRWAVTLALLASSAVLMSRAAAADEADERRRQGDTAKPLVSGTLTAQSGNGRYQIGVRTESRGSEAVEMAVGLDRIPVQSRDVPIDRAVQRASASSGVAASYREIPGQPAGTIHRPPTLQEMGLHFGFSVSRTDSSTGQRVPVTLYFDPTDPQRMLIVDSGSPAGDAGAQAAAQQEQSVDARAVAIWVRDQLPLPDMQLRANPRVGVVAIPSWFWLDGVAAPAGGVEIEGVAVEVEITPTKYRWQFGDGSSLESNSSGRPYPQESDVAHTYEASSRAAGTYATSVEVIFRVTYTVNGGPPADLGTLSRTYSSGYAVQQIQAVAGREGR